MRIAANDGRLADWNEYTGHLSSREMDVLEAFDRIEPIGIRPVARALAFIASVVGRYFCDEEAKPSDWWPEDEPCDEPVTSTQAINLMRAKLGE